MAVVYYGASASYPFDISRYDWDSNAPAITNSIPPHIVRINVPHGRVAQQRVPFR